MFFSSWRSNHICPN